MAGKKRGFQKGDPRNAEWGRKGGKRTAESGRNPFFDPHFAREMGKRGGMRKK